MKRWTKPMLLMLVLVSLIAIAQETQVDYLQVAEDVDIMARIIDKTLTAKFPDEYIAPSLLREFDGCQGVYLEGYGTLFLTSVRFPVAERIRPAQEQAAPTDLWKQTELELKGAMLPFDIGGNYDAAKVEQLREEVVKLIGTYALNIHQLGDQENVILAVRGKPSLKPIQFHTSLDFGGRWCGTCHANLDSESSSDMISVSQPFEDTHLAPRLSATPSQETATVQQRAANQPTRPASSTDPISGGAVTTSMIPQSGGSTEASTIGDATGMSFGSTMDDARRRWIANHVVANAENVKGNTMLIVKLNKASISAYQSGALDLRELRKHAEITQY